MAYQQIVKDLQKLVKDNTWQQKFEDGVKSAVNNKGATDDMRWAKITDLGSFYNFINGYVTWIPQTTSTSDEPLRMLSIFYFVFDQEPILDLQTPIKPWESRNKPTPLSKWLHDFANALGSWMDDPKSVSVLSINSFKESPDYTVYQYIPDDWKCFNDFFSRRVKKEYRPIAPGNKVVSPCDAKFDDWRPISDHGDVEFEYERNKVNLKGLQWNISELLADSGCADKFKGGIFMHSFLLPHNYHRVHAPVNGKVVKVEKIEGNVYIQIQTDPDTGRLVPNRRIPVPERDGKNGFGVHAWDRAGYQWNQVRGLIVIDTTGDLELDIGLVALFAVGMAQISSVNTTVEKGQRVGKGDELGYLKYGGSDYIMLFQKDKVDFEHFSPVHENLYLMGEALVKKAG